MVFKKQHFAEKKISEIDPETEINVCLTGRIIDLGQNNMVIDDGSGNVNVVFPSNFELKNLNMNNIVRLFGYVIPTPEGFDLRADFAQNMDKLDLELFNKIIKC